MYIRNDGKGESNITQNGFTAYLLSAVAHRKADYLHAKQRRQAREVLTDPDDLSTEEAPGISDPTDLLCCIENAALEEVLNRISERDRYIFFSRALHGRSFHELALELDLGYQGVAGCISSCLQKSQGCYREGCKVNFKDLLLRAKDGDQQAKEEIFLMYRPLLFKESCVNGIFDEDLFQELSATLIHCIRLFKL